MRSLYVRILIATVATVALSLAVFMAISRVVIGRAIGELVKNTYTFQADQAARALQQGGAPELRRFVDDLNQTFHASHYLTDTSGRDQSDGTDRSALLSVVMASRDRFGSLEGRFVYARPSRDERYWLVVTGTPPFSGWQFAPFYALVVASILVVSWLAAVGIASPLRKVAVAADRFGQGDLAARVEYRGRNEIGQVARSFNVMADRIQTLMMAERRLLQDVSHELRSPLTRLNFAAELARTAPDRDAAIDRLQVDLDRLEALVGELLAITRAEGDPAARRFLPVDMDRLIDEVVDACEVEAVARPCAIVVTGHVSHKAPGDEELLRRAIENVLRNAIRYAPAGSDVDLSRAEEANQAVIRIRDYGPGVPAEALDRLFDPFFRVDPARQTDTGNIGLGLSITQRAVQLHHGTIHVENAAPGLRVTLTLPIGEHRELSQAS